MIAWIRFAFRNLLRNRRRSAATILAVGIGFAAINVFGGFTDYIFRNLEDSFIFVEGNGHLSVFKAGAQRSGSSEDLLNSLLTRQEVERILETVKADPSVIAVSEMMTLTGLISNGDISTIFVGLAWVPSEKYALQNHAKGLMSRLRFYSGEPLSDDTKYGIGVSRGLADKLGIQLGSPTILMSPTVHGQINALDAEVRQIPDAPMELLEDKWILMPLWLARSLYGSEGATRVNLLLDEGTDLQAARTDLERRLRDSGMAVDIVLWRDLSPFYVKVEAMFRVIFMFMFVIVSVIIVMSVVNTMGMAVLERSREIGTLRAMGAKQNRVVFLFSLEGALLGLFGCLLGVVLFAATLLALGFSQPEWTPPHIARSIPLEVYIVPSYLLLSGLFLVVLSFAGGVFPARRVAQRNIVAALGHT